MVRDGLPKNVLALLGYDFTDVGGKAQQLVATSLSAPLDAMA